VEIVNMIIGKRVNTRQNGEFPPEVATIIDVHYSEGKQRWEFLAITAEGRLRELTMHMVAKVIMEVKHED
jgi:hypothetical protein